MNQTELQPLLNQSLDDLLLSRSEKKAFREVFADLKPTEQNLSQLRRTIFDVARQKLTERNSELVLTWVEELMKLALGWHFSPSSPLPSESHFAPQNDCPRRIIQLIRGVRREIDICVFTITDNRLADAILQAHQRGIAVRIITDNEKAFDLGSDVPRFLESRVPLKVDQTPFHMHHKFAIFDRQILLTGSYNWTRGAANDNLENFVLISEQSLLDQFAEVFTNLWNQLPPTPANVNEK